MPEPQTSTAQLQQNAWLLPDLPFHKPNCDSVTDNELLQAVISKWGASKNGTIEIPYTFQGAPYLTQPYGGAVSIYTQNGVQAVQGIKDAQMLDNVKKNIRLGLQSWEHASGGKLHFYEANRLGPRSHGLSFYLADEKTLLDQNIVAFTQLALDNKGYIDQAAIVFPGTQKFWDLNGNTPAQAADKINTVTHEIGHAIGSEHFHDYPSLRQKIELMKDGVYASVMPYLFLVESPFNQCDETKGHCNPPFAAIPGPLDERFVELNYRDNNPPERKLYDYYVITNVRNAFLDNAITQGAYAGVHSFAANLSLEPNKKVFSEKAANLITDGAYVGGMVLLKCPLSEIATFAATAGLKYLPASTSNKMADKIPQPIKAIFNSPLTGVALNLGTIGWQFYKGRPVLPLIAVSLAGTAGNSIGAYVGDKIGHFNAYVTGKVGQLLFSLWPTNENYENESADEARVSNNNNTDDQKDSEVLENGNDNDDGKSNEQQAFQQATETNAVQNDVAVESVSDDSSDNKRTNSFLSSSKSKFNSACNFFKTKAVDLVLSPLQHETDSLGNDDDNNNEDENDSYQLLRPVM